MQIEQNVINKIIHYVKSIMDNFTFDEHLKETYFPFVLSRYIFEEGVLKYFKTGNYILDTAELTNLVEKAKKCNKDFYTFCFEKEINIKSLSDDYYNINFREYEKK